MVRCPKCNTELADNAKFCSSCGAKIVEESTLTQSDEDLTVSETPVTAEAGLTDADTVAADTVVADTAVADAAIADTAAADTVIADTTAASVVPQPAEKKSFKKPALIGCLFAVMILLAVAATILFSTESSVQEAQGRYALYLKDSEIYLTDFLKKNKSTQISSELYEDANTNESLWIGGMVSSISYISYPGGKIFYPDNLDSLYGEFNLYYKELAHLDEEAVKLDSDVTVYTVNENGTIVTYLKDASLYQYQVKDETKEKVKSDIQYYKVSGDGKTLIYMSTDGSIYYQSNGNDAEKLVSDITSLEYVNDDLSTVWYMRDDALYKQKIGSDREKIATDVDKVIQIYDSGEAYYLTAGEEIIVADFLSDDLLEYFDDTDDVLLNLYAACYYDGTEEIVLSKTCLEQGNVAASDVPVLMYCSTDADIMNIEQMTLKDYWTMEYDDFISTIQDRMNQVCDEDAIRVYVAAGDTCAEVFSGILEVMDAGVFDDGTGMWYMEDGDLYTVSIENGQINEPELYDEDVSKVNSLSNMQTMMYYKDCNDDTGCGDLYINGNCVDYDVFTYGERQSVDRNLFYLTDYNSKKKLGTLKMYDGNDKATIAEDAYPIVWVALSDDKVLYLSDYNNSRYFGELYLWNGDKAEKIDDDVSWIAEDGDSEYRYWLNSCSFPVAVE